MEVGFKHFGIQYQLKEFNKEAIVYFSFHEWLFSVHKMVTNSIFFSEMLLEL